MKITTNHHWRQFKYRYEVPDSVLKGDLDWTTEDDFAGYFQYKGYWYHTGMFMRIPTPGWDGGHGDSFFSGVLIKLSECGEEYKVGWYCS